MGRTENGVENTRKKIGVIISETEDDFHLRAMHYLQKELFRHDMDILIFTTLCRHGMNEDFASAECAIYDVMNLDVLDGIIVFPHSLHLRQHWDMLERLKREFHKPMITVEGAVDGLPCVPFSEDEGMRQMVEHLVTVHGAKRIEHVSVEDEENVYFQLLQRNFLEALRQLELPVTDHTVHYGDGWIFSGNSLVQEMLEQPGGLPDAVVCCNTEGAAALIVALERRGCRVPEDIIVVGYGIPRGESAEELRITTVDRNPKEMAAAAVKKLVAMIEEREEAISLAGGCCYLLPGYSCGCSHDILRSYSRHLLRDADADYSSFVSDYNFMTEEITECEDYSSCIWKLDWYTRFLGHYESFYVCLNKDALDSREECRGFSDRMTLCLKHDSVGDVNFQRTFDRKEMLPALYEKCDHPRAFIFANLHFVSRVMGYVVLSYGNQCRIHDRYFAKWLRFVANALEIQRSRTVMNEVLLENYTRDSMTGLYNYRGYLNALRERYAARPDEEALLQVVSLDIDRFAAINDEYGRDEGNQVLCGIANILTGMLSEGEVCARVGSDEFLIGGFCREKGAGEELINGLLSRIASYNLKKPFSVSVHCARVCERIGSAEEIAEVSNTCIHKRKRIKLTSRENPKKSENYNEEERENVIRLIDDNLFTYQFQPIVSARDGKIYAYEALMRSGNFFRIPPLTILKHAEEVGRLYDIERHTFFNLMKHLQDNLENFELCKLFINSIPMTTLTDKDFELLRSSYGNLFHKIVVEFTEQTEASQEQLLAIRNRRNEHGFETAVDDYGSGYSNVSNLLTYMPNYVKVDRSLISNIEQDANKQYFVSNIIRFAHDNGFMALAEGVETSGELQTVIRLGVDLIQGYYTCRPQDEMPKAIDPERAAEIRHINSELRIGRGKKVFRAEAGSRVDLSQLYKEDYTELQLAGSEVVITGDPELDADITIRIPDNAEYTLCLDNVSLESCADRPCVELGVGCRLELEIRNQVKMKKKGIRVPDSSALKLEGSGDLRIEVHENGSYAIGGSFTQNFGAVQIGLKGSLDIQADGKESVGIGGGYASSAIRIADTRMSIRMDCVKAVACGSFYTRIPINIQQTKLDIALNVSSGVGIGSMNGETEIMLDRVQLDVRGSGDYLTAIGVLDGMHGVVTMRQCGMEAFLCAKECYGIASRAGSMDVHLLSSNLHFTHEGMQVVGIGSRMRTGKGRFEQCRFALKMTSSNGVAFAYEPEKMSFLQCEGVDE